MLVPSAFGLSFCAVAGLTVSGAAGANRDASRRRRALESLGRTLGPVRGNGSLQWVGTPAPYGSAALLLLGTALLTTRYHPKPRTVDSQG
jgi:hypothetical protein